jgi:pSer/pThr/pTyr-binding forkhead associated (FHA) protein
VNISVFKENSLVETISLANEDFLQDESHYLVGRSSQCHISLDDRKVSREHAEFIYSNGKWFIKKISSMGPIVINGAQLDESEVKNGDFVIIGPFTLNIEISSPSSVEKISADEGNINQSFLENEEAPVENSSTETIALSPEFNIVDEPIVENELMDDSPLSDLPSDEEVGVVGTEDSDDFDEGNSGDDEFTSQDDDEFSSEGDEENEFGNDEGDSDSDSEYNDDFDEGGDDEYGLESVDEDSTKVIQSFATIYLEIFGENAPYDKYVLETKEVYIGRDTEKCQILLNDPEVSAVHAVLIKNNLTCTLKDLNSANGTLLNGERVNNHGLTNNDEFIIGSTTFTVKIQSDFLNKEEERLMPVAKNQVVEIEEIVEVSENFADGEEELLEGDGETKPPESKSLFLQIKNDPVKRKKAIYALLGLVVLWVLLDEEAPKKKVAKKKDPNANELLLNPNKGKEVIKSVDDKPLTDEQIEFIENLYLLAKENISSENYKDSVLGLEQIFSITKKYKESRQIYELAKEGLKEKERLKKEELERIEAEKRRIKIAELVKRAEEATEKNRVSLAEGLFENILKLDPENLEVARMKVQIESFKREQEKIALEKAQKEAERNRQKSELAPGKAFYLKKEWFKAILKLGDFLKLNGIDEDYSQEASKMLSESKKNLAALVNPLIGKARSLKEGQDLKGSYENYKEVLKYDPGHVEALEEMSEIQEKLEIRSKRVYREAIIAESLSLFDAAKEKFQEVQQVSPSDSPYYKKATDKLKEYLD